MVAHLDSGGRARGGLKADPGGATLDDKVLELQRGAQQALGRSLLAVQQYEHLLKWLLTHHELAGSTDTRAARQAQRAEDFADQTLGTLAKARFKAYVTHGACSGPSPGCPSGCKATRSST